MKNLPPCIILEVGYLILLSSKILAGHFSKFKNVNGFYAITENISCNKTMLSGAATIYPSGYSGNYIGMTYGISINNDIKAFGGWIGRGDGKITDTMYSTTFMGYIVICK